MNEEYFDKLPGIDDGMLDGNTPLGEGQKKVQSSGLVGAVPMRTEGLGDIVSGVVDSLLPENLGEMGDAMVATATAAGEIVAEAVAATATVAGETVVKAVAASGEMIIEGAAKLLGSILDD